MVKCFFISVSFFLSFLYAFATGVDCVHESCEPIFHLNASENALASNGPQFS